MSSLLAAYTTSTYDVTVTSQSNNSTTCLPYGTASVYTTTYTKSKSHTFSLKQLLDSRSYSTLSEATLSTETATESLIEQTPSGLLYEETFSIKTDSFAGEGLREETDSMTVSKVATDTLATFNKTAIPDSYDVWFDFKYSGTTTTTSHYYTSYFRTDTHVSTTLSLTNASNDQGFPVSEGKVIYHMTSRVSETSTFSTIVSDTETHISSGIKWSDCSFSGYTSTKMAEDCYNVVISTKTKSTTYWSRWQPLNQVREYTNETTGTASTTYYASTLTFREYTSETYWKEYGHDDNHLKSAVRTGYRRATVYDETSVSFKSVTTYPIVETIDVETEEKIELATVAYTSNSESVSREDVDSITAELDEWEDQPVSITNTTYQDEKNAGIAHITERTEDLAYYSSESVSDFIINLDGVTTITSWTSSSSGYIVWDNSVTYYETTSNVTSSEQWQTYMGTYREAIIKTETTETLITSIVRENETDTIATVLHVSRSDCSTLSGTWTASGPWPGPPNI